MGIRKIREIKKIAFLYALTINEALAVFSDSSLNGMDRIVTLIFLILLICLVFPYLSDFVKW